MQPTQFYFKVMLCKVAKTSPKIGLILCEIYLLELKNRPIWAHWQLIKILYKNCTCLPHNNHLCGFHVIWKIRLFLGGDCLKIWRAKNKFNFCTFYHLLWSNLTHLITFKQKVPKCTPNELVFWAKHFK